VAGMGFEVALGRSVLRRERLLGVCPSLRGAAHDKEDYEATVSSHFRFPLSYCPQAKYRSSTYSRLHITI
jgi:hypothetical protein